MTSRSTLRKGEVSDSAGLADYLERVTQRLEAGEQIDCAREAAEHPEYADQLNELWPALEVLVSIDAQNGQSQLDGGALGQVGEFHILRELGRGGMGVVYEAEQQSLGRRVALKVLPFAAVLDPRQLARFQNEARAAASLHHTNIVPVFSVGCERGVHYYAMQLIDGRSLADVVRERQERKTAFIDAPQAQGTPIPIAQSSKTTEGRSLGPDSPQSVSASPPESETVRALLDTTVRPAEFMATVARLGIQAAEALAHSHEIGIVHRDVKPSNLLLDHRGKLWVTDFGLARLGTDAGVTMTGDVLGTLRYMSPEQASGKSAAVDHRSDVYSLGATLYELATGQPVFSETDRERLLSQVAHDDPVPPKRIAPSVPTDLETILLKCLEKVPSARYSSAQALADDLRRHLEHRPIAARRPTLSQRGRKLLSRHRVLVSAVLVTLCFASCVGSLLLWRSQRQASAEAARAKRSLALGRRAIDQLYVDLIGKSLSRGPLSAKEAQFLERALALYEQIANENEQDAHVWPEAVRTNSFVAEARYRLGDRPGAVTAAKRGIASFESLPLSDAATPAVFERYATCLEILALVYMDDTRWEDAELTLMLLLEEGDAFIASHPEQEFGEARAQPLKRLGALYALLGRVDQAEPAMREAMAIYEELARRNPKEARFRCSVGVEQYHLAQCFQLRRKGPGSLKWFDLAIKSHQEARQLDADDAEIVRQLVVARYQRARLLEHIGTPDESLVAYREAAAEADTLAMLAPGHVQDRQVQRALLERFLAWQEVHGLPSDVAAIAARLKACQETEEALSEQHGHTIPSFMNDHRSSDR